METRRMLPRIAEHLTEKYGKLFSPEKIADVVNYSFATLDAQSKVKTHLFTTTEHFADQRLHALAISHGLIEGDKPPVLFVCPSNTGRSQIAAALMGRRTEGAVGTRSGGVNPGGHLHHRAVEVLQERGIDLSGRFPKPIDTDVHDAAEYVVAMGCLDQIEQRPDTTYIEWDIPLLAEKSVEEVWEIVDLIERHVDDFTKELSTSARHAAA